MKVRIRYHINKSSVVKLIGDSKIADKFFYPLYSLSYETQDFSRLGIIKSSLPEFVDSHILLDRKSLVIFGDLNLYKKISSAIFNVDEYAANLTLELLNNFKQSENFYYEISNRKFDNSKKYVMGVLNITTDSFYDGGEYIDYNKAKSRIDEFVDLGVDIIDIGGESTRPGSEPIPAEIELERILPAVEYALKKNVVVSIDTYKSTVAKKCLDIGAHIINDISGFRFDGALPTICSEYNSAIILMHIRGTPKTMQINPNYDDVMQEIFDELNYSIRIAEMHSLNKIFVDPGIGFGKRLKDNYEIIQRLEELKFLGYPILVGLSRKSFIGKLLNKEPKERLTGTIASNSVALIKAANIIRVHDVNEAIETKKIIEAIQNPDKIVLE